MVSLQTKLCLLFGRLKVYMACIDAQEKPISNRMKVRMQNIAQLLILYLDPQDAQSPEYCKILDLDANEVFARISQYWIWIFDDTQCWNKKIIDDSDPWWNEVYLNMRSLAQSAHNAIYKLK